MDKEQIADDLFSKDVTIRERAAFELGIKLGTLFHISMGIPSSNKPVVKKSLENALENSIKCQPYVTDVKVTILSPKVGGTKSNQFDYFTIGPESLEAEISLVYKNIAIKGKLVWVDSLQYPLMTITKISEV